MRILLIEDEVSLSEALVAILKKNNYAVDAYYDGESGLYAAQLGSYDVIVLDILLPKMNGFNVLKTLREGKVTTPIILLTAKASLKDKATGFSLGADDYLTKPFQAAELLMRINALSRRKGEIETSELVFGDCSLDTNSCIITCKTTGKTMQLSAKEFQVLEYMMRNSKSVISKDQFLDKIWGYETDADYNSVEVYISFIRKKMAFVGCKAKIKVVRGIGYTLSEEEA